MHSRITCAASDVVKPRYAFCSNSPSQNSLYLKAIYNIIQLFPKISKLRQKADRLISRYLDTVYKYWGWLLLSI